MSFTFTKNERQHEFRLIRQLFAEAHPFFIHPFKVTWLKLKRIEVPATYQLLISVPKAVHRKSTERNFIRRRIREAYRLNKSILYENNPAKDTLVVFCITYTSKELLSYSEIQDKIILLLRRLKEEGEKDS